MALIASGASHAPARAGETFDVAFVAAFLVILCIALVSQMLMLHWRDWFPGAESEKSLIGGVRAAVSCFMSLC